MAETLAVSSGNTVTTRHPDYVAMMDVWQEMRDHVAGSRTIKEKGTQYLPMLGSKDNPNDVESYKGYLMRALYYEATKRTHKAMVGAIMAKDPTTQGIPEGDLTGTMTRNGLSFPALARKIISEVIEVNRCGALVERGRKTEDSDGELYVAIYHAEDIINWRFERVGEETIMTLLVLRETREEEDGRFGTKKQEVYRVLELLDGIYTQTEFIRTVSSTGMNKNVTRFQEGDPIIPDVKGKPLTRIPFTFFNDLGDVPDVAEPLLSGVASVNHSHYLSSADLEHGRHFTGLPTAWVAGFPEETELTIGSGQAWVTSNESARAGFLEFTGQGLRALEVALQEKQEQMATMGARMLRPPKTGVEAAETARIYQSAESGTLSSVADAMSLSFTALLRHFYRWRGMENVEDISLELNKDYVDSRIDSSMLTALINSYLVGGISYETLFYNLKQGEVVPGDVTADKEREAIEMEPPRYAATNDEPAVGARGPSPDA